ncbi:MAG: hypothetical protein ABI131_05970 [Nostocoides sp.]
MAETGMHARPGRGKILGWLLGLGGVFIAAIVSGLAGRVVDAVVPQPATTTSAPSLTDVRFVRPFDNAGTLLSPYVAKGSSDGNCIQGQESSDPSALRCVAKDGGVYDPCWLGASTAVCLSNPWEPQAWLITNPVVASFSLGSIGPTPWALDVESPSSPSRILHCGYAGGTGGTVAGMRVNYGCFDGVPSPKTYVGDAVGNPKQSDTSLWTILYVAKGSSDVRTAAIRTVWH